MRSCSRPRRQHRPATRGCGQRWVRRQQRGMGCVMQQLLPPGAWSVRADAWRAITPSPPCGTLQQICSCAAPLLSRDLWLLPCTPPHVRQLYAQAMHTATNTATCFSTCPTASSCRTPRPSRLRTALPPFLRSSTRWPSSAPRARASQWQVCVHARTDSARAVVSVKARPSATGSNTGTRNSQGRSYVCLTGAARACACAGLRGNGCQQHAGGCQLWKHGVPLRLCWSTRSAVGT